MNVRWGIIGCGNVTEVKSGPAFQKIPGSQLVAVMRRNADLAEDYAKRHNVPKWYSRAKDLIDDPDVNAIYIATPPNVHLDYVKMAAASGKPVYVEKPVGRSFLECEEINSVCNDLKTPLFTAYYRRAQPRFLYIKDFINSGQIGNVRFINVQYYSPPLQEDLDSRKLPWRLKPEISGGGRFIDLASHTLDILNFIFGPITDVKGFAINRANIYKAEDTVNGIFFWGTEIQGSGTWSYTAKLKLDNVLVVGEKGNIYFGIFSSNDVVIDVKNKKEIIHFDPLEHVEMPMIKTIIDELNGTGKCPSNGTNALQTWWVMEKFISEYYQ
jgi:predicted dehydrogenase